MKLLVLEASEKEEELFVSFSNIFGRPQPNARPGD